MSMNSFHARTARPLQRPSQRTAEHAAGVRADWLLVQQGLAASRAAALRLIAAGRVSVKVGADETAPLLKPAQLLPAAAVLHISADQDQTHQGPSQDPT